MAPGFGTAEELAAAKAADDYWARPAWPAGSYSSSGSPSPRAASIES